MVVTSAVPDEDAVAGLVRALRPTPCGPRSLEKRLAISSILKASGTPPQPPRVGRLEVQSRLGGGAMGVVYRAYDPALQRSVALKVLRGWTAPTERKHVVEEARRLAQLSHPNVVPIHDIVSDDDDVHIVMEYVQGVTLGSWLAAHPKASWQEVLQWFIQAGRGLAAAHEAGMVHRDFKPDNVLAGDDGRARVVDFGLAVLLADTGGQTVAGSPYYMAPEVLEGTPATPLSDQYSFCRALGGALRDSDTPAIVTAAVERGVSADAGARHASMTSLVELLAQALEVGRGQRPRQILLERVERLWLRGVLDRALVDGHITELTLRHRADLVTTPWEGWDMEPVTAARSTADESGTATTGSRQLTTLLSNANDSLLLLGTPGSGKTTLLLQLCRELWRAASLDPNAPAPAVLSLSTYHPAEVSKEDPASDARHFRSWVTDEMVIKYGLPRPTVKDWLDELGVVLLLDGLDETDPKLRARVVQTLNNFRQQQPLGVAITCRDEEYQALDTRLLVGCAVEIEPMDDAAVISLLRDRGASDLLEQLTANAKLIGPLRNPLLLTLSAQAGAGDDDGVAGWQGLYDRYVARALAPMQATSRDAFARRIGWLARAMERNNVSDLWLERLGRGFLDQPWERRAAYVSGVLMLGLFSVAVNFAHLPLTDLGPGVTLVCGLGAGIASFAYTWGRPIPVERVRWSLRRARGMFPKTVLWIWLVNYAAVSSSIGPVEALRINFVVRTVASVLLGLALSLIFALEPSDRATQVQPNAGIRQSLATSLRVSIGGAIPFGLFFHFVFYPIVVTPLASAHFFSRSGTALMATGIVFTLLFLVYGGFAVLMHYVLRLWLRWRTDRKAHV